MMQIAVTFYEYYMSILLVKLYAYLRQTPENSKDTGRDKLGETYGRQSQLTQPETLLARTLAHA